MLDSPDELTDEEVRELMARCRRGEQQAATILFRQYVDELIALVRQRLSPRLASRVDPEDILQSAYGSFFDGLGRGEFSVECADELWGLLATITLHKLCHKAAFHRAQKRAVQREHRPVQDDNASGLCPELIAQLPSPAEAAEAVEVLEGIMDRLVPQDRTILELRLAGYSCEEIADLVHRSDRTVRRAMERVRDECRRQFVSDSAG